MKLENQVCNLKLSKRLKELGVPQESLWYHWQTVDTEEYIGIKDFQSLEMENFSAFTVAELGEMLPKGTTLETFYHSLEVQLQYNLLDGSIQELEERVVQGDTEADARARLLIYLLENNLINKDNLINK